MQANQSALQKQRWAFIYSRCFHRVTFRKRHSDDSVQKFFTELIILYLSCARKVLLIIASKLKCTKKILKKFVRNTKGFEDFINKKLDEICFHEKLSAEEVICFLVRFLPFMFPGWLFSIKTVSWYET